MSKEGQLLFLNKAGEMTGSFLLLFKSRMNACVHSAQELLFSDKSLDLYICFTISSTFRFLIIQVIHEWKCYEFNDQRKHILLTPYNSILFPWCNHCFQFVL